MIHKIFSKPKFGVGKSFLTLLYLGRTHSKNRAIPQSRYFWLCFGGLTLMLCLKVTSSGIQQTSNYGGWTPELLHGWYMLNPLTFLCLQTWAFTKQKRFCESCSSWKEPGLRTKGLMVMIFWGRCWKYPKGPTLRHHINMADLWIWGQSETGLIWAMV